MLPPDSLQASPTRRKGQPLIHAEEPRFRLSRLDQAQRQISDPVPVADPRLQSNYDLAVARGTVEQSKESFAAFAERETAYFINFYRKWVVAPRLNALAVAYEDLIEQQERTLTAVIGWSIRTGRTTTCAQRC